jgi:hypothetical protein
MSPLEYLSDDGCLFPVGTEAPDVHLFCGDPRDGERPYCPEHCRQCLRPAPAMSEETIDAIVASFGRRPRSPDFRVDLMRAMAVRQ